MASELSEPNLLIHLDFTDANFLLRRSVSPGAIIVVSAPEGKDGICLEFNSMINGCGTDRDIFRADASSPSPVLLYVRTGTLELAQVHRSRSGHPSFHQVNFRVSNKICHKQISRVVMNLVGVSFC